MLANLGNKFFLSRMYQLSYYNSNFFFNFYGIVDGKKLEILCNLMILDIISSAADPHKYGVYGTVCT